MKDLLIVRLSARAFSYALDIHENGSIDIIFDTIEILIQNNIELPDIKLVEFSTINQFNGWGDPFDGT